MSEYHFTEGAFQLPDAGVVDKSTTALEIPVGTGRMMLVMSRENRGDKSIDELLEASLKMLDVSLRRFRHEAPRALEVGGRRAFEFTMTWMHDEGPMVHKVALIEHDQHVLTLTVAAKEDLRASVKKVFDAVVASMKWRRIR